MTNVTYVLTMTCKVCIYISYPTCILYELYRMIHTMYYGAFSFYCLDSSLLFKSFLLNERPGLLLRTTRAHRIVRGALMQFTIVLKFSYFSKLSFNVPYYS